jgi:oxygen-independent coproporphyrinogen-3 oxidase
MKKLIPLLKKYDKRVPRYTSYPPANNFSTEFTDIPYQKLLVSSDNYSKDISIYIHIPFCSKKCSFCGCNSFINSEQGVIEEYLIALNKEINILRDNIGADKEIVQIHFGGGTPNHLNTNEISSLLSAIKSTFSFSKGIEIAMECNPAYLSYEYLIELYSLGINRLSIGIQDYDLDVLKLINRDFPYKQPKELLEELKEIGFKSVNFDIVYGLPGQTLTSFSNTIEKLIESKPDRIALFSYAHLPQIIENQKQISEEMLPALEDKLSMLISSHYKLKEAGYINIGMDHFALPNDSLAISLAKGDLHRNFQGYCEKEKATQVYAIGISGITQLNTIYAQNTKNISEYIESIEKGNLPIKRGYRLSYEETIIRDVINQLMCNFSINFNEFAATKQLSITELYDIIGFDKSNFQKYIDDQLINIDNDSLTVNDYGCFVIRNIVSELDPALKKSKLTYSRTI